MAKIAYKDFRLSLRRDLWPPVPGEPANLVAAHNKFFLEAMNRAGKYVEPCLQVNHTDVHKFCSTYVECAKTIVPAPIGVIKRVYTIANDEWCDKVFYNSWSWKQLECWAVNLSENFVPPANVGLAALKGGARIAESSTDIENGRARTGAWAIHNQRLYVTPWLQSNESLVIEWDGIKRVWNDDDLVDDEIWDPEVQEFIKLHVMVKHNKQFNCSADIRQMMVDESNALAEAIHSCEERTKAKAIEEECETTPRCPTAEELEDDAVPTMDDTLIIGNIGDFGDPDYQPKPTQVADLVKSWDPDFIVTNGDNIYSPAVTYEEIVGLLYGDFITDELATNKFWPSIGNHDHNEPTNGIQDYFDYFTLPNNERYYDFVKGPIHFFVLHSGIQGNNQDNSEEVDGIQVGSAQAEWLRVRLALSTAPWKVVIVHDAPYTNGVGNSPGFTYLRWPFKDWGADLILSGDSHGYERLSVDGLPYIVNGAGGTPLREFIGSPSAESVLRYNDDNGAGRMTVTCDELKYEFFNTDGTLIDTLTLTQ